jgi:cholera toxin transcriptional activator
MFKGLVVGSSRRADGNGSDKLRYFLIMPTPQPNSTGRVVRFGIFEVDLVAGELRKKGAKVRLQEQPFQMLALLLARHGEVVTREELRQKLWPVDTFVDFDHSLNTAVNKIREALGDSATSPRYVETLARRGYRFIAPVEATAETEYASSSTRVGREAPSVRPSVDASPNRTDLDLPIARRSVTRGLFALIQIMYLIFYLAALFHLRQIDNIASSFLPSWEALAIEAAVLVTAGPGIPLRCYLLSAVGFDYPRFGEKFPKLFLPLLVLDELWAIAPFLLVDKIGLGAAFAATAGLLYIPFSERTLVRMAYPASRAVSVVPGPGGTVTR